MADRNALAAHLAGNRLTRTSQLSYRLELLDVSHAKRLAELNHHRKLEAHTFVLKQPDHVHISAFVRDGGAERLEAVVDIQTFASSGPWILYANVAESPRGQGAVSAILKAWRKAHPSNRLTLNAHVSEPSHRIWRKCHFVADPTAGTADAMVSSWDASGTCTVPGCALCGAAGSHLSLV